MTEEEKEKFQEYVFESNEIGDIITLDASDWLNEHHFDYRRLIEKGLALKALEEMYDTKTTCNNCEDKNYCSQSEYVKSNCYKLK